MEKRFDAPDTADAEQKESDSIEDINQNEAIKKNDIFSCAPYVGFDDHEFSGLLEEL